MHSSVFPPTMTSDFLCLSYKVRKYRKDTKKCLNIIASGSKRDDYGFELVSCVGSAT